MLDIGALQRPCMPGVAMNNGNAQLAGPAGDGTMFTNAAEARNLPSAKAVVEEFRKRDQAFLEGRIQEIEAVLRNAIIVEKNHSDVVSVGSTVTVQEENFSPETYHIVGAKEADSRNRKISNESPLGKAILNHKVGDTVKVETPGGTYNVKILKVG